MEQAWDVDSVGQCLTAASAPLFLRRRRADVQNARLGYVNMIVAVRVRTTTPSMVFSPTNVYVPAGSPDG